MKNNQTAKTGIPRLLEISAQKPWHLLFAVLFSSIAGILQFMPYFSAFKVIEIAAVNHNALNEGHIRLIMAWVIAGVICVGGGFVFMYAGSLCSHTAAFRILYGLRMNLAKKLTELPLGFHSENSTGRIRKILEFNVEQTELWIAHSLPDYMSGIVGFFVILVMLFGVNIWLTLVFLVVVLAGVFIATRFSAGEKGMEEIRQYQNSLERINASAVQYVNGMPAVKIFNRSAESFQTFKKDIYDYQDWAIAHTKDFRPIYTILLSLIKGIALFVLPAGVLLLTLNPTSLNYALSICMFLILAPGIVAPIFKVVGVGNIIKRITGGVERIDMIFNTPPLSEPATGEFPRTYDVLFSDVRFSYNPKDKNPVFAIDGISFSAEERKITALVGPSGGGKSTIAQLIPRFWDIEQGEIRIGGVNINRIRMEDLNTIVSFVFQDCFLFFDTIRENIRGGKTNAAEEEIIAAAKAAQCHDFITALPDGYDTLIGEGGIYLSGGEEQRINIARAILKNTPVLVLDEATAFADSENEALLYRAIQSLIQNKTVIMIAHRLSTIVKADKIVVIDNGKILEQGTHHDLVKAGGLYTGLYAAYTKSAEWTVSGMTGKTANTGDIK
jgi:ATP-binding cassette subfamily B protein